MLSSRAVGVWARPTSMHGRIHVVGVACAAVLGAAAVFQLPLVLAALVAMGALLAFLDRAELAGYALVGLAPVTSGIRPGIPFPGVRPSEALIVGIGLLFLVLPVRRSSPASTLDRAVTTYVVGSVLAAAFHAIRGQTGPVDLTEIIGPIQFLLLYWVVAATLRRADQRDRAVRLILLLSIPMSIVALLQQLDVGPTRELILDITDSHVFDNWGYQQSPRATGLFPSPHPFAGYLAVVLILAFARLADRRTGRTRLLVVASLAATALLLSQTFTSVFAVALGLVVVVYRKRSVRLAWWAIVLGIATVSLFGSTLSDRADRQWGHDPGGGIVPETVQFRIDVWTQQYAPLVHDYWPLGYGAGFPPEVVWDSTESGYLTLLLRGGIPLLAIGVWLLWTSYRTAASVDARGSPVDGDIAAAVVAVVIALVPMNLVWPYLTNSGLSQALFVLLGLLRAAQSDLTGAGVRAAPGTPISSSWARTAALDRPG